MPPAPSHGGLLQPTPSELLASSRVLDDLDESIIFELGLSQAGFQSTNRPRDVPTELLSTTFPAASTWRSQQFNNPLSSKGLAEERAALIAKYYEALHPDRHRKDFQRMEHQFEAFFHEEARIFTSSRTFSKAEWRQILARMVENNVLARDLIIRGSDATSVTFSVALVAYGAVTYYQSKATFSGSKCIRLEPCTTSEGPSYRQHKQALQRLYRALEPASFAERMAVLGNVLHGLLHPRFAAQTPEGVLPKADWKTRLEALAAIGLSATDLTVHYSEEDFCGYSVRLAVNNEVVLTHERVEFRDGRILRLEVVEPAAYGRLTAALPATLEEILATPKVDLYWTAERVASTKAAAAQRTPFSDIELDRCVVSLQGLTDLGRVDWAAVRALLGRAAHLPHQDWAHTEAVGRELLGLLTAAAPDAFRRLLDWPLRGGRWDDALAAAGRRGPEERPWAVLITGLNGIRKTTAVYQPWFQQALATALHCPASAALPTGRNSFFRQLDFLMALVANAEFRDLYRLADPPLYRAAKAAVYARHRTLAEAVGVALLREAQRHGANVMLETSGRDAAMFQYVDTLFADTNYQCLALHFTINDVQFAEASVDRRMALELKRGQDAIQRNASVA
eukprot:EG_transcript_6563